MVDTLRNCIVAEPRYTFLSLDASQIELRVLAILSADPQMLEDLKASDLHLATAIRMYGFTDDEDEMKIRRYKAKQGNFADVYGIEDEGLAELLGCPLAEVLQFREDRKEAYPIMYQWMDATVTQAKEDGYVMNIFGRIRPLPELYAGSWRLREQAEKKIVNTICQGTAVDIVKMAMLVLRGLFDKAIHLVLQVHDEIIFEVPDGLLSQAIELSKELVHYFPEYPFVTCTGKVYGSMEEVK